jgi:hypothetical protein
MVRIDVSIFYAGVSYGHVNGDIDIAVPSGPGARIDLSGVAASAPPAGFSGQLVVDSVLSADGVASSYACVDVCVASRTEAQIVASWLDALPGLSVWPNDLDDPLYDGSK